MTISQLDLGHKELITERLDAIGMHLSEFSFANLYLFRNTHEYKVVEISHGVLISGLSYDHKRYLMPMMSPNKAEKGCFEELKALLKRQEWDFIFPIPEEWLECFKAEEFDITSHPNDSDYLYHTEKFKTYPGKSLHKKKNLLNQFLSNPNPLLLPLTDDKLKDAKGILELWQNSSRQELATSDYHQCLEALELREKLELTGAIAYADGKPAGFILGEKLNEETFTIHFAKADMGIKGSYQFLFSRFARDFCSNYTYMNLEQDMGREGLRKTKVSYRPDLMAHKYRISPK